MVLVGPHPPLRGGVAAHTAGLAWALGRADLRTAVLSWRQLYPTALFPGRGERAGGALPAGGAETLHWGDPRSWRLTASLLATTRGRVVVQWWHPLHAMALAASLARVDPARVVLLCHNARPHEPFPLAGRLASLVASRAATHVFHGESEARRFAAGRAGAARRTVVPMPCLMAPEALAGRRRPPELEGLAPDARVVVAAGYVRSYKAVDLLVAAWRRARLPGEAVLVVAGESYLGRRQAAGLAAAARDSGIVLVDRYVTNEEFAWILTRAEVLVAAYRRASQSALLPLAALLGLGVVVSDAGSLAGQAAGMAGREVVPAGDEGALAAALGRMLGSDRGRRAPAEAGPACGEKILASWSPLVEAIAAPGRPWATAASGGLRIDQEPALHDPSPLRASLRGHPRSPRI